MFLRDPLPWPPIPSAAVFFFFFLIKWKMKDWQFATADVTANSGVKVTVMEMRCNTLVTPKVIHGKHHSVQVMAYFTSSIGAQSARVSNPMYRCMAVIHMATQHAHMADQQLGHGWSLRGQGLWKVQNVTTRGVLVILSFQHSFFFVSIQLWCLYPKKQKKNNSSHILLPPGSFPQMILDSANAVADVFGKISIFSRWWWPSTEKSKGSL